MFESKLACMKENQLVWKRMTLYERKWASVKVTVNPLLSTRLAKPHPANARQTTWTQRHPGILHHCNCIEHALVRVFGLATSAGTTSSCTRRWRSSSSTPTPTTIFRKSTWKVKCFKGAERREPGFQQQGDPTHIFLIFTTSNSDFLAQRMCSTCGSILKNTRRRWSSSWNAQWALWRRRKR